MNKELLNFFRMFLSPILMKNYDSKGKCYYNTSSKQNIDSFHDYSPLSAISPINRKTTNAIEPPIKTCSLNFSGIINCPTTSAVKIYLLKSKKTFDRFSFLPIILRFLHSVFLSSILVENKNKTDQSNNQKKTHHNIICHIQSSLSIIKAIRKNMIATIIPKTIFGKSTNLGEISKPNTWLTIISFPISSHILEIFSFCFFVNFINIIIQHIKIIVNLWNAGFLITIVAHLIPTFIGSIVWLVSINQRIFVLNVVKE